MFLSLLLSCVEAVTVEVPVCEVSLTSLSPAAAGVGDEVVLSATPLSEVWDTVILVGGVRAELSGLTRDDCDDCDSCREDNECSDCFSDCDACDAQCAADCVETATFVVPELEPGLTTVELFNTHGGSERIAFEVLGTSDTGAGGDSADTGG
jgi:hypothetical protein